MQFITASDGGALCLGAVFLAASGCCWVKYFASSSTLGLIRDAPSVCVSDLRSLIDDSGDSGGRLVVVRGQVQAKPGVSGCLGVVSKSGELAVAVQRSETCIYNKNLVSSGQSLGLDILQTLMPKATDGQCWSLLRSVPFLLVECDQRPHSACVHVNLGSSTHPLPLTEVCHHTLSPWHSFMWPIFGGQCPVLYSIEERFLPVGKQITAVGICVNKDGALEIKPCMQLPYFLSDKTKEEIEMDLTFNTKILFWVSAVLGVVSLSFLGYAIIRNWPGRKINGRQSENEESSAEDSENVPDGELCVICLARRRVHAFVPCGHRICCHSCAVRAMESLLPKCYLCQQRIISYMRIYNS